MQENLRINPTRGLLLDYDDDRLLHIDPDGRWISYHTENKRYHRTLDGRAVILDTLGHQSVRESDLSVLINKIHSLLKETLVKLKENFYQVSSSAPLNLDQAIRYMEQGLKWQAQNYQEQQDLFDATYPDPVPILPPDRYRDIVILPATGCPHGKCTFCAFYRNQQFHVFSDEEFRQHITLVRELFNSSFKYRNGIFLGSASGLSVSQGKLLKMLDIIDEELGIPKRGIASFMDPHHIPNRTLSDYYQLYRKGLRQVTIGLETGDPELRSQIGKKADLKQIGSVVNQLKEANLQVAITILTGFDSTVNCEDHQQKTVSFLSSLPLGPSDIIYLSPLLTGEQQTTSDTDITNFKKEITQNIPAKTVPYRIDRFSYLA